jgi:hypothetical protein
MRPRLRRAGLPVLLALCAAGCPATQAVPPGPDVGDDDGAAGEGDVDVPETPGESTEARETDGDADRDDATPECTSDLDCNDLVDCTSDSCNPATGTCTHEPMDVVCDDGDACTTGERCDPASGCVMGTTTDCSDGIDCTRDTCDPFTGSCSHSADHRLCTPPQLCIPAEGCCVTLPCTVEEDCSDGDPCNGIERCDPAVGCQPGTAPDCNDGIPCTVDTCNPLTGACQHAPDDAVCDNRNPCDGEETCDSAAGCQRGTPVDCSDGLPCTEDVCDPATGSCSHVPENSRCDDGMYCNGAETCDPTAGCVAGPAPSCDDGVACTIDRCDPATDSCIGVPDDARCDDGQFCNGGETCSASANCVPGTAPVCDDGLSCTTDVCDPSAAGGRGGCVARAPDRDGDTYGDAACSGTDCDDTDPAIHPGATELCNARDDNCDGRTDETFACVPGSAQGCILGACTGSQTCSSSCLWSACTVGTTEVCNGVDDNCNGVADEGFTCILGRTQACAVGSCPGTQACVAGCTWGACTATPPEVCNGIDDNCNGLIDEGFSCILGQTQACWVGSCAGTQTCGAGCAWGSCVVSAVEVCNGADDDCNGAIDETFACRLGTTQGCANGCGVWGSQGCAGPSCTWGACCAGSEVCGNACDDDCDGLTNEGCACSGDDCSCPLTVAPTGGTYGGTTVGMAANYDPTCAGWAGIPDVVYSFTPATGGLWQIDTIGSGYDTVLYLYAGGCPGSEIACDDDGGPSWTSVISATLTAGVTYYIVVDGYSIAGTYVLNVTGGGGCTPGGGGTSCSDPYNICSPGSYSGDTCGLSNVYAPSGCYGGSGPEMVFTITVPAGGRTVTLSTCGSGWDTVLYVRSATCDGTEVACNDDDYAVNCVGWTESYISVWLGAGRYYVFADGYASCGYVTLNVSY